MNIFLRAFAQDMHATDGVALSIEVANEFGFITNLPRTYWIPVVGAKVEVACQAESPSLVLNFISHTVEIPCQSSHLGLVHDGDDVVVVVNVGERLCLIIYPRATIGDIECLRDLALIAVFATYDQGIGAFFSHLVYNISFTVHYVQVEIRTICVKDSFLLIEIFRRRFNLQPDIVVGIYFDG